VSQLMPLFPDMVTH